MHSTGGHLDKTRKEVLHNRYSLTLQIKKNAKDFHIVPYSSTTNFSQNQGKTKKTQRYSFSRYLQLTKWLLFFHHPSQKMYMLLKIGSFFPPFYKVQKPKSFHKKLCLVSPPPQKKNKKTCWTHICPSFCVGGENGPNFPCFNLLEKDDKNTVFFRSKTSQHPRAFE